MATAVPSPTEILAENRVSERGRELLWLGLFLGVLLIPEIRAASLRPFWFDELSTLFVTTAPSLRDMFRAVPVDGNPPLYFLLARLCLHLPLHTELAMRIPSLVAINIAAVTAYIFVRRNAGPRFGLLAVSVFLATGSGRFAAIEGRPYALLLCFTGLSVCCWQLAARHQHRRAALAGITVAMAGAILSHHYGVIYVSFPLLCGEAARISQRRRLDLPILAAMAAGCTTLIFTIPPTLREQADYLNAVKYSGAFGPHWADLAYYIANIPTWIPLILIPSAFVGLLAASSRKTVFQHDRPHTEDVALGIGLALILPVIMLVIKLGTNLFEPRYAVGSSLGVALLCGLLPPLWRSTPKSLVSAAFAYCTFVALLSLWFSGPNQFSPGEQVDPLFRSGPSDMPLVMADGLRFLPTWWYSDAHMRSRLHYLSDLPDALHRPEFRAEYVLILEQHIGAPKLDHYADFLAAHREFLLFCDGAPKLEWMHSRFVADGWKLVLLSSSGKESLYRVIAPER
jgi:hypothetical protein